MPPPPLHNLNRRYLPTPPRILPPPLPPPPHIPPTSTAATLSHHDQPPHNRITARDPHEHKHLDPDRRHDIHARLRALNYSLEDQEHGCGDDRSGGGEKGRQESQDSDRDSAPAAEDGEGCEEDAEEG